MKVTTTERNRTPKTELRELLERRAIEHRAILDTIYHAEHVERLQARLAAKASR
jgi:hypothetical protein